MRPEPQLHFVVDGRHVFDPYELSRLLTGERRRLYDDLGLDLLERADIEDRVRRELAERGKPGRRESDLPGTFRAHDLINGEQISGRIVRLPKRGAPHGHRLFIDTGTEVVGLTATAKRGHMVLERQLRELDAGVGDRVTIEFRGKKWTKSGEHQYRDYWVEVERG